MSNKPKVTVLAKAIMTHKDGHKIIVEVHGQAGYSNFYLWYRQDGRQRKVYLRASARELHRSDDLETVLASQLKVFNKTIVASRLMILKKKAYRCLVALPSSELPGGGPVKSTGLTLNWKPSENRSDLSTRELNKTFRRHTALAGR